jgi:hypothetical protein
MAQVSPMKEKIIYSTYLVVRQNLEWVWAYGFVITSLRAITVKFGMKVCPLQAQDSLLPSRKPLKGAFISPRANSHRAKSLI